MHKGFIGRPVGWWVLDISLRTALWPNIGLIACYKITKGVGEFNLSPFWIFPGQGLEHGLDCMKAC